LPPHLLLLGLFIPNNTREEYRLLLLLLLLSSLLLVCVCVCVCFAWGAVGWSWMTYQDPFKQSACCVDLLFLRFV
jgi:hypothetical protein